MFITLWLGFVQKILKIITYFQLGISAIFKSINSGITKLLNTDGGFYVSSALQKAYIEVNEEGAEAAAVTSKCIVRQGISSIVFQYRAKKV